MQLALDREYSKRNIIDGDIVMADDEIELG